MRFTRTLDYGPRTCRIEINDVMMLYYTGQVCLQINSTNLNKSICGG